MLAVALALGLSLFPQADLEVIRRLVGLIGIAGVVSMISAVAVGVPWLIGWGSVLLLGQYGLSLAGGAPIDSRAPWYAAGLLLMVESAYASLEQRAKVSGLSGNLPRDVGRWAVFGLGGLCVAALVMWLASVPVTYGILVQVAGVGAATALLTTLVVLVRRRT